jgi:antitoxin (DNA-binding transcriptional repressor) of toxin-antitoxin stability system
VLVTRNGKPAAALVPIDEYEALEETAEILSDSATLAAIEAGLAELARGESVTLDDLRRELAERRAARGPGQRPGHSGRSADATRAALDNGRH